MLKIIDTQKTVSTEYVKDILCAEFEIENLINSPNHPVGNTNRKGIQTSGTWNFILKNKPTIKTEENTTTSRKKTTTTSRKKSNSIRNRMSKIANVS